VKFAKGHGTQNDFVLLPDVDAALALTPAAVAALCDRRRGIGADGVLRVTTAAGALAAGVFDRIPEGVRSSDWYMDYRNADGSIAQMCGNGVRVFAHYLRVSGLEQRDEFVVGSLAGPRPVVVHSVDELSADVTVEMGKTNQVGTGSAIVGGRRFTGLAVDVGNPHLACVDASLTDDDLLALDVAAPVSFDAAQFRRNPFVRNGNRGGRRRRVAPCGRLDGDASGAHPGRRGVRHDHRRLQFPARPVDAGGPRRTLRRLVAGPAALIQMRETALAGTITKDS